MTFRNIAVTLSGNATGLNSVLRASAAQVERFGAQVEAANNRQGRSWKQVAGGAILAVASLHAVEAGFRATIGAAAGFEQRMRNVNSITHTTEEGLRGISQATLNLSKHLPQTANTLAEGLYDIASSGFQGADGLTVLEAAAQAASAGLTTTANSAKAIDAVLNAYGLSAASAQNVSDSLFQTVNLGVISFEQLTGVIGDVVGTAAAAGVDINQLSAAIATMTLSGLSAEESGTSLNRVLQSLLQPSESLGVVFKHLGYESGQSALATRGLHGVMEDLRKATGGNVTSLLQLFPEIRAARGAFALMSNEGRTYTRVAAQIEDADARQGATRKALAEQLKAVSAQWQIFKNQAAAAGIEAGTRLLPVVLDLMHGVQRLAQQGLPVLNSGLEAMAPFFTNVRDLGIDVVHVLGAIADAAAPVAAALLRIGAGAVISSLNVLSGALADVTGFIADNEKVVIALAGVYLATLLPTLAAARVAFNRLILTPLILGFVSLVGVAAEAAGVIYTGLVGVGLGGLSGAAVKATSAIGGLSAGLTGLITLQTVATAGFAAVFALLGLAAYQWHKADESAKKFVEHTTKGFDALDAKSSAKAIGELRKTAEAGIAEGARFKGAGGNWKAAWALITGDDVSAKTLAAAKAMVELKTKLSNAASNMETLRVVTGLSTVELTKLAHANKIDLSKPYEKSNRERSKAIGLVDDLAHTTGLSARQMAQDLGLDIDGMKAFGDAVVAAGKKVSQSFNGATDIIANFKPGEGAKAVTAANEHLTKSEQKLADLQARQAGKKKQTTGDDVSLAAARRNVAAATDDVRKAQDKAASGSFEATYRNTIAQASAFADNLQKAARAGLDPQLIARLLEAGPEAAAPVLQAIVADHSGRLVQLANTSEQKLQEINLRVVEFSRLTLAATSAATDRMVRDLGSAMEIASQEMATAGKSTAEQVALAIGAPSSEVKRIALEFGITIADSVQAGIDSRRPRITVGLGSVAPGKLAQLRRVDAARAGGGILDGPGTGTSDSLLVAASKGEYVHRAAAVSYYGVEFMNKLNRMQLPKFAAGGVVGRPSGPSGTTTTTVVRVPMQENRTHSAPVYVENQYVANYDDFRRKEDRERRFRTSPDYMGG